MRIRHLLAALALLASLPALALDRPFPKNVKRGAMTPALHPAIVIDGKTRMLTPGARIWNELNLIEQPAALRGENIVVNYTETELGEIDRVWILTKEEAAEPIQKQRQQATQ